MSAFVKNFISFTIYLFFRLLVATVVFTQGSHQDLDPQQYFPDVDKYNRVVCHSETQIFNLVSTRTFCCDVDLLIAADKNIECSNKSATTVLRNRFFPPFLRLNLPVTHGQGTIVLYSSTCAAPQ